MDVARQTDNNQTTLWNGPSGQAWVELQEVLDHMFRPFEELLVEAVRTGSASRVLDVGCGTGSTTLAVARLLGASGRCMGIDISEPMIATARDRADREGTPASFLRADAQISAIEPAGFDMIISRFGVMFFEDPIRAFANLRQAARHDAELHVIAWRSAEENTFMTTAERAAAHLLPSIPARQPDGPGQFAFADQRRVSRILEESGWSGIEIQPIDAVCTLPENELVRYVSRLGPLGRVIQDVDEATRAPVLDTVRAAFAPFVHGTEVRFTAACWMVRARAPSV
jgi:ubiquinone/menaquinone biosynthesis C-methylase UbiE